MVYDALAGEEKCIKHRYIGLTKVMTAFGKTDFYITAIQAGVLWCRHIGPLRAPVSVCHVAASVIYCGAGVA